MRRNTFGTGSRGSVTRRSAAHIWAAALSVTVTALLWTPRLTMAQTESDWTGDIGNWSDSSNWNNGTPTSSDAVFMTNGGTAVIAQPGAVGNQVFIGPGNLNVNSGGGLSDSVAFINAGGSVTVQDAGSSLSNTNDLYVGNDGTGNATLTVQTGGTVSSNSTFLGASTGCSGSVTVDGQNSQLTNAAGLYVGNNATGTLTVQNGAMVSNANTWIGGAASGAIVVTNAGSSLSNSGNLYVGGTYNGGNGSGSFTVQNGATTSNVSTYITSGGTVNVTGGATMASTNAYTDLGSALTVDGLGSEVTFSGSVYADGTVTAQNGGRLTVSGNATVSGAVLTVGTDSNIVCGGLTTGNNTLQFGLGSPVSAGVYNGGVITVGSNGLNLGTGTNISFSNVAGGLATGNYRLIGGNINAANLSNFTLPSHPAAETFSLSNTSDPGFIDLAVGVATPMIFPVTTPPTNPGTICKLPTGTLLSGQLSLWDGTHWQPILSTVEPGGVPFLDTSKPTDVITHGWNDSISNTNWTAKLAQALQKQHPNVNILAWDWSKQAVSDPNDPNKYPSPVADVMAEGLNGAAASARRGAIQGAQLANELHALGVNDMTLSLIGHSNGGAVIGKAASRLSELSGVKVDSLTTLDTPEVQLTELPTIYQNLLHLNSKYLHTRDYAMQFIDPSAAVNVTDYYSSNRDALGFGKSWPSSVTNAFNEDASSFLPPFFIWDPSSAQHRSILPWYISEIGSSFTSSSPSMMAERTTGSTTTENTSFATVGGTGNLHPVAGFTDLFGAGTTSSGINATPALRPSGDGYSVRIAGPSDGYLFRDITLPSNAEYLDFNIKAEVGTVNDFLTVSFGNELLYYRDFGVVDGGLVTVDPIYIGDLAGQTGSLLFALNYGGTGSPSVLIDNVSVYAVPEPASLVIMLASLTLVVLKRPLVRRHPTS